METEKEDDGDRDRLRRVETELRLALGDYQGDDWLERACATLRLHLRQREWDASTVGGRIRTARELAGMSQAQLSLRLNLEKYQISRMERGQLDLPARKVVGLCASLGIKPAWLLGESEEGGPDPKGGILRRDVNPKLVKWKRKNEAYKAGQARVRELNERRAVRAERAAKRAK